VHGYIKIPCQLILWGYKKEENGKYLLQIVLSCHSAVQQPSLLNCDKGKWKRSKDISPKDINKYMENSFKRITVAFQLQLLLQINFWAISSNMIALYYTVVYVVKH
jgi:hypothetical protein